MLKPAPPKLPLIALTTALLSVAFGCCFNGLSSLASVKDMNALIPEAYLKDQFQWTMIVDLPDSKNYLNYPKSKLWPLTRVRADFKSNVERDTTRATRTYYEEIWYHNDRAVGLRRHSQIFLPPNSQGAIVICPGEKDADRSRRAEAIIGAITRLSIDIQLRNGTLGVVLVPDDEFKTITDTFSRNHFSAAQSGNSICSLSVTLLSYPGSNETTLYLQD